MAKRFLAPNLSPLCCPECGGRTGVIETRNNFRRRRCNDCGARFSTYEIPAEEWDKLRTMRGFLRSILGMMNATFAAPSALENKADVQQMYALSQDANGPGVAPVGYGADMPGEVSQDGRAQGPDEAGSG